MKPLLWILNSSLIAIFTIIMLINSILKQKTPTIRMKPIAIEKLEKKKVRYAINIEKIFKQDIFDTFIEIEKKPTKQSFVTPIPSPKTPTIAPPPEPKKYEFIPHLNITLKGIIFSPNQVESIVMIEDETKKEKIYHLSDKIKDAQILKITRNNIVALRANGQQEIFYLRKNEEELEKLDKNIWQYTIKKINDENYQIDLQRFTNQIQSLGNLMGSLNLVTAYQKGNPIGIRVGQLKENGIGPALGLKQNDIIIKINGIDTANTKNRTKIYDIVFEMQKGETLKTLLKRNNQNIILNYKLSKIEKPIKQFLPFTNKGETSQEFKMSPQQKRTKNIRDFKKFHVIPEDRKQMLTDIRKRLLNNMKLRAKNRRVR
ncbi:hypothetical protein KAT08_01230 [Candidatus Babeliales bacterium]|nr:hypothetical protein [Candidatus Babeliales bacterium]